MTMLHFEISEIIKIIGNVDAPKPKIGFWKINFKVFIHFYSVNSTMLEILFMLTFIINY